MKMRPFRPMMLLAASLACMGVGAGSPASYPISSVHSGGSMKMLGGKSYQDIAFKFELMQPAVGNCAPRPSWHRLNQRQIRKNLRRAHAAGARNAFA